MTLDALCYYGSYIYTIVRGRITSEAVKSNHNSGLWFLSTTFVELAAPLSTLDDQCTYKVTMMHIKYHAVESKITPHRNSIRSEELFVQQLHLPISSTHVF